MSIIYSRRLTAEEGAELDHKALRKAEASALADKYYEHVIEDGPHPYEDDNFAGNVDAYIDALRTEAFKLADANPTLKAALWMQLFHARIGELLYDL